MQVRAALRGAGMFVDADVTDRKMQKKVREAQLAQYNYILVVGEQVRHGTQCSCYVPFTMCNLGF